MKMTDESEFNHHNPEKIINSSHSDAAETLISRSESCNFLPNQSCALVEIRIPGISASTNATINLPPDSFETDENHRTIKLIDADAKSKKGSQRLYRYVGLLLAILSSLMFSINALIFKMLDYNPPLVPATYMFLGTAILNFPLYLHHRCKINKSDIEIDVTMQWGTIAILLARGFTGCSGMIFFFYSLQYLSIGDALVIACSSPVFVFLLAWIILKENCGIVPVVTVVLALIGVVIITRPPLLTGEESFKEDDLIGAGLAFSSMLSIASTLVLMRYLQSVHHTLINLTFGIWGTLQCAGLAFLFQQLDFPRNITEIAIMSSTGFVFCLGQTFLAISLQLEEAGPVSLLRTSEVLFAFIWQLVFLKVVPDAFSISGTILIMIGILTTILRKWIVTLPATHVARQRLGALLK